MRVGDPINEGQAFARVRRTGLVPPGRVGSFGHLHFSYQCAGDGANVFVDPLRYLFPANTVTESIVHRTMTFNPRDGAFPIYGQDTFERKIGRYIKKNVDLLAEMNNNMGATLFVGTESDQNGHRGADASGAPLTLFTGYSGVPAEIAYAVDKPNYVRRGSIAEQRLERFDQRSTVHEGRRAIVYDEPLRNLLPGPGPDGTPNRDNYTYKVTSTDGTTPDANHFWNSNAMLGGSGDGSGPTEIDTLLNANSMFQDGVYLTKSIGYTVNGQIGGTGTSRSSRSYRVLVNNFKQTAEPARAAGEQPSGILAESNEQNPGPERELSPPVQRVFQEHEPVYAKGAQFVDNWEYTAYAVIYDASWEQDEPFRNIVAQATVHSDILGVISGTLLWPDPSQGLYNIIIDYDNNHLFSWTLDGLGTFLVIPEPASASLFAFGSLLLLWHRRKRAN